MFKKKKERKEKKNRPLFRLQGRKDRQLLGQPLVRELGNKQPGPAGVEKSCPPCKSSLPRGALGQSWRVGGVALCCGLAKMKLAVI